MDVDEKVKRARVKMQKVSPFVYLLITHMNMTPEDDHDTAWVDASGKMGYSEKWFATLTTKQIAGVIAHETLHVALLHVLRTGGRDKKLWNIAIDMKCNDIIIDMASEGKDLELPKVGVMPENHRWSEGKIRIDDIHLKSGEQIYAELYEQQRRYKVTLKVKGMDEHRAGSGDGTSDEAHRTERKWKQLVIQAATTQRMQGKMPASLEAVIDGILDSKVKWYDRLYRYITNTIPVDFTYLRPNKKSASVGVYMPDIVKEQLQVVVSIDTSGSISDKELKEFMGEVAAIGRSFANVEMTAIICDAKVHDVFELSGSSSRDPLEHIKLSGRGGTDHRPVEKWIKENKPAAELVICLTDGYTSFPKEPTGSWLWVLTANACNDEQIPFGEIVRM